MGQNLHTYMKSLADQCYFNGAVLVAKKGEILLSEGYGSASFQYKVPTASKTKYRIGSLSKAFTAAAILKLVENGQLTVTDTIDQFFPDMEFGNQITVHQLLSHTSGIPDFTSSPDYWTKSMRLPSTLEQVLDSIKGVPHEFGPGEKMEYCNTGYLVLTALIERISGKSYSDFLAETIFQPIGMMDTGVDDGRTIIPHLATGHTLNQTIIHTEFIDMSFPLGAYGLYSTVEDLFKWGQALRNGNFLNKELVDQMFTPNLDGYGYGWFILEEPEKVACHSGDINGFVSDFYLYVEKDVTIIVLSNLNMTPVEKISQDLSKMVFGKEVEPIEILPKLKQEIDSKPLIGEYENKHTMLTIQQNNGNSLLLTVPKKYGVPYTYPINLVKVEHDRISFQAEFLYETLTFELGDDGISLHYIDSYGREQAFVKK
ncbi:class A beta-lactamase-related serine hydrolase [Bacillus sp. HNG]|uniref:serine hydrolase domain-containing protein n=1 Tax=Bacillus sp. HNG TaxID=2293325 RepID=UPI000E2F63AC|nr:serine hydrolase domain-containing protein [Bacillus sp. HNG]RFB13547.1 class A beta-lactamase-related serine hydrolase [Bacillus sp. HNG]